MRLGEGTGDPVIRYGIVVAPADDQIPDGRSCEAIVQWLSIMRAARDPGPVTLVKTARGGRDVGWEFPITDDEDLRLVARRMGGCCRTAGMNNYEFSARDGTGRVVGRLFYNFDAALLVPSANSHADYREGARPAAVDASARPLAALLEEQRSICERLERVERQLAAQRSALTSLRKRLSNRRGTDPPRRSEG
jgi:hypothetical protein